MTYKKITTISLLFISFFLGGCALFESLLDSREKSEVISLQEAPTEREKTLTQADAFFKNNNYEAARPLYLRLSRNSDGAFDPVYDQALWQLVKIYEKNDESEKAILSLDELAARKSGVIPSLKINFALLKQHYRITNFNQAQKIKKQIDQDYRNKSISLTVLYGYLIDTTELNYDVHILEELMFLGEVQKYFVYVMESKFSPQNEKITARLINSYDRFFTLLGRDTLSEEFKKKLAISLYDQLNKFIQYKFNDDNSNPKTVNLFSAYCEKQQKILTESFYQ